MGSTALIALLILSGASSQDKGHGSQVPPKPSENEGARSPFAIDPVPSSERVKTKFKRPPRAGMLFNVKNGGVLWQRNPNKRLPIASLTKLMTVLVVAERTSPHERVKITKEAVEFAGSGIGKLPRGKKVQLEALMNGLMLVSGNDAAIALAQHLSGSVKEFVDLMNRRAERLGLSCSHFTTPNGLEDKGNWSCAVDLAVLARANLHLSRVRRIARRSYVAVKFPIKGGRLHLANNNPFIRRNYPGATGLKTGYTSKSGRCIVATAKRGKVELGVVLLNSYDPYTQARKLLNAGFKKLKKNG